MQQITNGSVNAYWRVRESSVLVIWPRGRRCICLMESLAGVPQRLEGQLWTQLNLSDRYTEKGAQEGNKETFITNPNGLFLSVVHSGEPS